MEARRLLAADLHLGAVYYEDAGGGDDLADTFQITWSGGASGTHLSRLIIDTDKHSDGLTIGDVFFDTATGGLGAFGAGGVSIAGHEGFEITAVEVMDGGTTLVLSFSGFDAGEQLLFTVDVDEQGFLGPNAIAEGNEFEGSTLSATFTAPRFFDATAADIFYDAYDSKLLASGLSLPADTYQPPNTDASPVRTAGAFVAVSQLPLPVSIAGTVFEDRNVNNSRESDDPGISGVQLTLFRFESTGYVPTGSTVTTDAAGHYRFDGLPPGRFRVVEVQPAGYASVGAAAGTVNGAANGVVTATEEISDITLLGGEDSIGNDFAEALPGSIRGRVHADRNGNCLFDQGEPLLSGVTIHLLDATGAVLATTNTDGQGEFEFSALPPGTYGVSEVQPAGYFDGGEAVGSAGGTTAPPDTIAGIVLASGTHAAEYNFCEHEPASLAGTVYLDDNNDGAFDSGESGIAGVTLLLLGADGSPLGQTATTDDDGAYVFAGLAPGVYGIAEIQPAGLFDGLDAAGSAGGTALNPGDQLSGVILQPGTQAQAYNFGELRPAEIGGGVHADANADCVLDPGEPPLEGVTIHLLDEAGSVVAITTTDAAGRYLFENLVPGTYGLRELQPDGFFDGLDHVGSAGGKVTANDLVTGVSLGPGVEAGGYSFCEIPPGTISGYVFQDGPAIELAASGAQVAVAGTIPAVGDGRRGPGDVPIPGVTLRLADASGALLLDSLGNPIEAETDGSGFYVFENLPPGLYTVLEIQPEGYIDGLDSAGSLGGIAVNPGLAEGGEVGLGVSILSPGLLAVANHDAIALIPLAAGQTSVENNFSEVRVVRRPEVPTIRPDIPVVGLTGFPQLPAPAPPPPISAAPPLREPLVPAGIPSVLLPLVQPYYHGMGHAAGYTWHLSIIDAGRPRGERAARDASVLLASSRFDAASWQGANLREGRWTLPGEPGERREARKLVFGKRGGLPVTGDFNGDGVTDVGIFWRGHWFIDLNGNGAWDEDDLWAKLGADGDLPVTGDWDGDGKTDIGIFGRAWPGDPRAVAAEPGLPDPQNLPTGATKNIPPLPQHATLGWRTMKRTSRGPFRADVIDHVFHYGTAGDIPVTGDWNGGGVDTIGVFRDGRWVLDVDGDGQWSQQDASIELGERGDLPVAGDFNGDGIDELGIYRRGTWHIDTNGDHALGDGDLVVHLGTAGDRPVVGDFNGDGRDEVGVYRDAEPGAAGDRTGDRDESIGTEGAAQPENGE